MPLRTRCRASAQAAFSPQFPAVYLTARDADTNERKEIFSRALISCVPLAAHIRRVLDERTHHTAPRRRFIDELEDHMTDEAAQETLRAVISWSRFAELFSYDKESETFSLENPT